MINLTKVRKYYIACGYTDLRLGIDGLAAVVTQQYGSHLDEESLFLFCGRRTDRIRALYWCGDGYILLYKRLPNGRFQWPRSEAELRLLDSQSFRWLNRLPLALLLLLKKFLVTKYVPLMLMSTILLISSLVASSRFFSNKHQYY